MKKKTLKIIDEILIYGHLVLWGIGAVALVLCLIHLPWYLGYGILWLSIHLAFSDHGCPIVLLRAKIKKELERIKEKE